VPWHRDEVLIACRNYDDDALRTLKNLEQALDGWLESRGCLDNSIRQLYTSPELHDDTQHKLLRKRGSYKLEELEDMATNMTRSNLDCHKWETGMGKKNSLSFYKLRYEAIDKFSGPCNKNTSKYFNRMLMSKCVNSAILLHLLKSYEKYRTRYLAVPDVYVLCGLGTETMGLVTPLVYVLALISFVFQIIIPLLVIHTLWNPQRAACPTPSQSPIVLKAAAVIVYQSLMLCRTSHDLNINALMPSKIFSQRMGEISMFMHAISELLVHVCTFLLFISEEEGGSIVAYVLNCLAMQFLLKMNCVPYVIEGGHEALMENIKARMIVAFIDKSERIKTNNVHKQIQKWSTILLWTIHLGISVVLARCA
tara:strand:+ start:694 stop:1791 length:1098 start_codon:yes stop_codon:yes gene_type:complete